MGSDIESNSQLAEKLKQTTLALRTVAHVNKDIGNYYSQPIGKAPDYLSTSPWLSKPEIPPSDEILGMEDELLETSEEFVDIAPNKIVGPWGSKEEYLKAHYELLREEAVAPLRDAVAIFRNDPDMDDNKYLSAYEKVIFSASRPTISQSLIRTV